MHVALPRIGTWAAWRAAARDLTARAIPPEAVTWSRGAAEAALGFEATEPGPAVREVRVPKAFVAFARDVAHHSDPERFALLHLLLHRLQDEPGLMAVRSDPLVHRLAVLEKAVRRDRHKTHAFVRFREVPAEGPRRRFGAWFEPDHPTLELSVPHFAERFTDMDWSIATPDLTAIFEDGALRLVEDGPVAPPPRDATQDLWNTYYASIFNPARLKVHAMRAEMPKKYWRNLPEAELIPDLIAGAARRAEAMRAAAPTEPPARTERVRARRQEDDMDLFAPNTLEALRKDAEARYPAPDGITHIVMGEGPEDADVMVVGEQPGDKEDLAGRPFVGPAGQLFDEIARRAGLPRERTYVTNAVKHFKYELRGKRRIHKSPSTKEIDAVRWWLDQEREIVKPALVIAMGGSAVHALTGDKKGLLKRRGGVETAQNGAGEPVFVTVHPSFLLRLPDAETRAAEEARFEEDLRRAWALAEERRAA